MAGAVSKIQYHDTVLLILIFHLFFGGGIGGANYDVICTNQFWLYHQVEAYKNPDALSLEPVCLDTRCSQNWENDTWVQAARANRAMFPYVRDVLKGINISILDNFISHFEFWNTVFTKIFCIPRSKEWVLSHRRKLDIPLGNVWWTLHVWQ